MTETTRELAFEGSICGCPCHTKGDPGDGYVYAYADDRNIWHEDWISCGCESTDASVCTKDRIIS